MKEVRVRFAPSPTGALHIGGIRTALYNFLLARKFKGTMILRIEDTDQARYVPGAEDYILESLAWAGIQIDEGVGIGGPYAPYRQSERKEIYQKYAQKLIDEGHAYYAFDTADELDQVRKRMPNFLYDSVTRQQMKNSVTLAPAEVKQRLSSGQAYVIRLRIPAGEEIHLTDLIRGDVTVHSSQIDDKVMMKSDGMPTYHLANVVDDHLMKISHVIRGEEWLPSAPLHVLLYKFLGCANDMPQFAHLPLLLKPDGNGKLSKRDADRMGFPIFPLTWADPATGANSIGFREKGFLPDAMINFLTLLGWNPGTQQEIFSMEELIQAFSIERVVKAGAKFDIQKAHWFNQQYLRAKSDEELAEYLLTSLRKEQIACSPDKAILITRALKERVTFPVDFWEQGKFFFIAPDSFDEQAVAKKWTADAVPVLDAYQKEIGTIENLTTDIAKTTLEQVVTVLGMKPGQVLAALRISLTGGTSGPDLMQTIEILGGRETARRITYAIQTLGLKTM